MIRFVSVLFFVGIATAQTFTIRITDGNSGISGVQAFGTHGVNDIPALFSDSTGSIKLDTNLLQNKNPSVVLAKPGSGLKFSPAEFQLSLNNCPQYTCHVVGTVGDEESTIIQWRVRNTDGTPLVGAPVHLTSSSCSKLPGLLYSPQQKSLRLVTARIVFT